MSGERRARVEAYFRPRDDEPGWRPTVVAFFGLVGVGLGVAAWGAAVGPGGWLLGLVWLAPYVLTAYLLGWPRAAWAAGPAYATSATVAPVVRAVLAAPGFPQPDPTRVAVSVGLQALVVGVGATGGAAWLWDRVRRGATRLRAGRYTGILLLLPGALVAVRLLVPGEWGFVPFFSWGFRAGRPEPLTGLALGGIVPPVAVLVLWRWRPAAARTFVDRGLAAGVVFVPVYVVGRGVVDLFLASWEGFEPGVGREGLNEWAVVEVAGMFGEVGEAYLAVALAALASLWLLPHRYEPPKEEG